MTNWAEYDAGLRARGSLTVWFTPEAIEAWTAEPRTGRGGQPRYSDLAIATALTLRAVFRLALRQTEGLIGSILQLLDLDLPVPDHSTLSRRAETLEVPRPQAGSAPMHLLVDSIHPVTTARTISPTIVMAQRGAGPGQFQWRSIRICRSKRDRVGVRHEMGRRTLRGRPRVDHHSCRVRHVARDTPGIPGAV